MRNCLRAIIHTNMPLKLRTTLRLFRYILAFAETVYKKSCSQFYEFCKRRSILYRVLEVCFGGRYLFLNFCGGFTLLLILLVSYKNIQVIKIKNCIKEKIILEGQFS